MSTIKTGRMKEQPVVRLLALALLALSLVGCAQDGGGPDVPLSSRDARTFAMGFSSLPPEFTEESYARAFEMAGEAGELILIQRVPPWDELLRGAISEDRARTTQRETQLAKANDLDLFVAIDPTEVASGRRQLAGLPDELQGAGFDDPRVRQAFLDYAQYVAVNYQPKYLALGAEINSYVDYQPEDFEQFVSLYRQAYDAVKQVARDTLVFPTFQLERLAGRTPGGARLAAQWQLLERFEPKLDLLAVSSYPGLVFDDPDQIPASYYRRLSRYSDKPVAIAQTGYPSASGRNGRNDGSEAKQAAYLGRVLEDAERLEMPFVVWFAAFDPPPEAGPQLDPLQHLGLVEANGAKKASWLVWADAAARPFAGQPAAHGE